MRKLLMLALCAMMIASCKNKSAEASASEDTMESTENTVSGAADEIYNMTSGSVYWTGSKAIGDKHTGTVAVAEGFLGVTKGALVGGEFVLDMSTISSTDLEGDMKAKLDGHLKAEDFFDVTQFPTATFAISSVEVAEGMEDVTHLINGDLTVKGITKPVQIPASVSMTEGKISVVSKSFGIDRTEWDIKYGSGKFFDDLKDKVIDDEIKLNINLETAK